MRLVVSLGLCGLAACDNNASPTRTCPIDVTIEPAGTVPFTSEVVVGIAGERADTAVATLFRVDGAERSEVSSEVATLDGPREFVLTPQAGLTASAHYEVEVLGCNGEVVESHPFQTSGAGHPVEDWGAFDGSEWVLDLAAEWPSIPGETGFPVLSTRANDAGLTEVELGYFVVEDSEWWTCAGTIELDWSWDGDRLLASSEDAGLVGIVAFHAALDETIERLELSCGVSGARGTLVDCRVYALQQYRDEPCDPFDQIDEHCVPCGPDNGLACLETEITEIPAYPVDVERPDPFWDDECQYYFP